LAAGQRSLCWRNTTADGKEKNWILTGWESMKRQLKAQKPYYSYLQKV